MPFDATSAKALSDAVMMLFAHWCKWQHDDDDEDADEQGRRIPAMEIKTRALYDTLKLAGYTIERSRLVILSTHFGDSAYTQTHACMHTCMHARTHTHTHAHRMEG